MEKRNNPSMNEKILKLKQKRKNPQIKSKTSPPKDFSGDGNEEEKEKEIKGCISFIKGEKINPESINKKEENKMTSNLSTIKTDSISQINEEINNKINDNRNNNYNNYINKPSFTYEIMGRINNRINEIIYNAEMLVKTEYGCKLIEIEFEYGNEDTKNKIFDIIKSNILELSSDEYGNYVVQKILNKGDEEKIITIFNIIQNNIFELSCNKFGYQVILTLIEKLYIIDKKHIKIILEKLKSKNLFTLFKDKYGKYIILKIIGKLNYDEIDDLYDVALKKNFDLIADKCGSYILEEIIKKYNEEKAKKIIDEIIYKNNFTFLCTNECSNYVLQHILQKYSEYNEYAFHLIKGNIFNFSINKYASKIVQIIFDHINQEQKNEIAREIIENDNKSNCILKLANNGYGNYILQKIIIFCSLYKEEIIKRVNDIPPDQRGKYWKFVNRA